MQVVSLVKSTINPERAETMLYPKRYCRIYTHDYCVTWSTRMSMYWPQLREAKAL